MISLAWPWVLIALPLPLLVWLLLPPADPRPSRALKLPFYGELLRSLGGERARRGHPWMLLFAWLAWLLLVVASARPQWLGNPVQLPVAGRDLMLAVDVSGSMGQQDYLLQGQATSRLDVVKAVAGRFIEERSGDRLGLILFGSQAYLQTPLTFDRKTVRTMLDEAAIGLAGIQTAVGDAIALGVKRLRLQPEDNRVLILLTDGATSAGSLTPVDAAQIASQFGVRVYTIGIGAGEIGGQSPFGMLVQKGQDLDPATLKEIARITGGRYFEATDAQQLEQVYAELNRLEPSIRDTRSLRPVRSLYIWPAGAALVISILLALAALTETRPVTAPDAGGADDAG